jgi:hypothetical protein
VNDSYLRLTDIISARVSQRVTCLTEKGGAMWQTGGLRQGNGHLYEIHAGEPHLGEGHI